MYEQGILYVLLNDLLLCIFAELDDVLEPVGTVYAMTFGRVAGLDYPQIVAAVYGLLESERFDHLQFVRRFE